MAEGGGVGGGKKSFSDLLSKVWGGGRKPSNEPQSGVNHSTQHSEGPSLAATQGNAIPRSNIALDNPTELRVGHRRDVVFNAADGNSIRTSNIALDNSAGLREGYRRDAGFNVAKGNAILGSNIAHHNLAGLRLGYKRDAGLNAAERNSIIRQPNIALDNSAGLREGYRRDAGVNVAKESAIPGSNIPLRGRERHDPVPMLNVLYGNGNGVAQRHNAAQGLVGVPRDAIRVPLVNTGIDIGTSFGGREREALQNKADNEDKRGTGQRGQWKYAADRGDNIHPHQHQNSSRGKHPRSQNWRERQGEYNQEKQLNRGERGPEFSKQRKGAGQGRRTGGQSNARNLDQGLPTYEVHSTENKKPWQNRDGHQNTRMEESGNRNAPRGQGRVHVNHMHYKRLEDLSEQDPSDVVLVAANTSSGFSDLLKGEQRPDMIMLIVKVLAKVCQVDFAANKSSVLSTVCNSKFLDNLSLHIAKIPMDDDRRRKAGLQEFFENLAQFFETVLDLMPNTACDRLLSVLMMTSMSMQKVAHMQNVSFEENLLSKLQELETDLKVVVEDRGKKQVRETSHTEALRYQLPPDDFRDLSIFPTSTDILSSERVFIRPNIIHGAYFDIEHYLDVQFRLLREDFVWPLRDGITQYLAQLNQQRKKKTDNIRIYHNVCFEGVKVVMDHMGLVVSFECKSRIKWEYSKRFMFGSLLCFTQDNFKNVLFATVLDRNVKDLEQGKIVVKLSEGSEFTDEIFQTNFILAESEVYFEPYYHVLKALQKMKQKEFPMSKYIVYVQSDTSPPHYVQDVRNYAWNIGGFQVPVLVDAAWPSAEQLELDNSQFKAYKAALTKEFVVIQGPPGTGKTYLGLKIARTLLQNVNNLLLNARRRQNGLQQNALNYDSEDEYSAEEIEEEVNNLHSPMLVVCFTNHALDQFLEGLMSTTHNIIRVGGQSKSEILKPFNLKEKRRDHKRTGNMFRLSRDIRSRMFLLMSRIKGIQEEMRLIDNHTGIVSITCIAEVYTPGLLDCFKDDNNKLSNSMLLEWLLEGSETFELTTGTVATAGVKTEVSDDPLAGLEQAMESDEEDLQRADMDDYELGETQAEVKLTFILNFEKMVERLENLQQVIAQEQLNMAQRQKMVYDETLVLENEVVDLDFKLRYFTHCLKNRPNNEPDITPLLHRSVNLWGLNHAQRWALYRAWLKLLRGGMLVDLRRIEVDYRTEAHQFEETKHMEDLELMRKTDVVGMTTTCAARLQPLLQALKARIVIVEEAAEVMESHIIVSLTNHCQHLILIGDHQQLRPTTAVYNLAKEYHFDISLFERMLENGLHCEVIKVQHRMRPEIASLIVPSIYSELHNHESVLHFKKIQGIDKSVFFLTHNIAETEVGETSSRKNEFEGNMILALCRHLLLQGFSPDRITILTTYSGQMFYLREERRKYQSLSSVQITIVDNFQGEENDIILLSLVRNNKDNNVGFLKIANRVCVALSRAKHGMYIMGNINNLIQAHGSNVWPEIKKALDKQGAVGEALMLRCQIHSDQITEVRSPEDFNQVPEGGCRLPCNTELVCGHICKSLCHVQDREHKEYKCNEPCTRYPPGCVMEHICPGRCYATCGQCLVPVVRELPCEHNKILPCYVDYLTYKCIEKVKVTPADCGHTFDKPCHRELSSYPCPHPCNVRLDCGHSCAINCHVSNDPDHLNYKCKKQCQEKNAGCSQNHKCSRMCHEECGTCLMIVTKKPPACDHVYKVKCHLDPATIVCERPCKRQLPCGHPCPMMCCQPCGNCPVKVKKKVVECGHEVLIKCCEEAERRHCKGPCQRNMPCGHRCTRVCKVTCSTRDTCNELVPSRVTPICGHRLQVPCCVAGKGLQADAPELLSYCREPCSAQLSCGHLCSGSCGDCLQGRIHKGCQSDCGRTLICSHACTEPCTKACPPCKKRCRFCCLHSACKKECGIPCTSCKEQCPWECEHLKCTKLCGEMCNRPPCYEPCKKILKCDHPCIGFCGEPCPPLCRVCNEEEVTTIFFGNEDEEDARFIYLKDCKHTIESEGLENWLNQDGAEIVMPKCPVCKSDIMNTLRFMNRIKQIFIDICGIKEKVFGEMAVIENSKGKLETKLKSIQTAASRMLTAAGEELFGKISEKLKTVHNMRKVHLSIVDIEFLRLQIDFFSELQDMYNKTVLKIGVDSRQTLTQYLNLLLSAVAKRDRFSEQEVSDFNMEIRRFQRITELCQLETTMTKQPTNSMYKQHHMATRNIALSIQKYSLEKDNELKDHLQKLSTYLKSALTISAEERRDIVKAMGLPQGHWFKCPKGHYYAIGDCGGAMQVGKCFCGEAIGGSDHRLLATNRFGGEMDGAAHSHWPGTAMM